MFDKRIVIDGRGHLLGRLASTVAKQLLSGQKIVIVRAEEINISGSLYRNKLKYKYFLRKRCNINPARGPFHFRAPAKMFWRTVRGMIPHKTSRGNKALSRMKVFEGVPPPFDKTKRLVVPSALRVLRLRPGRRFCVLGNLAKEVGWKYQDTVKTLEAKRKIKSLRYYKRSKGYSLVRSKAIKQEKDKIAAISPLLNKVGIY